MADGVEVSAVREEEFEALLPLIAAYQAFYEVEDIDTDRNRDFFRRFLAPSEDGELLAARAGGSGGAGGGGDATAGGGDDAAGDGGDAVGGEILGYACLYWHFSSTQAVETVLMNDLFVSPDARGRGVGRALIEASAAVARRRGAAWLEWATAPDNHTAQALYDSMTPEKSTWLSYEMDV